MRTITISCPACRTEFKKIPLDEAEIILFHACEECRKTNREPLGFRGGGRRRATSVTPLKAEESRSHN